MGTADDKVKSNLYQLHITEKVSLVVGGQVSSLKLNNVCNNIMFILINLLIIIHF